MSSLDKFEFDSNNPKVKESVFKHGNKLYREWRHDLHRDYYLTHNTDVMRLKNPPPDVSLSSWAYLVTHFSSDIVKKLSERNKKNREKEGVTQVTSRKSFQSISYAAMDPDTGERPNEMELWRMTHQRPNGTWADEKSHEEMMNLLSHPQASQSGEDLVNLTPKEVFVRVIGERSGHARGLGCAPRGATTRKNHSQEQIEQMLKELEMAETHVEKRFEDRVAAVIQAAIEKFMGDQQQSRGSTFGVGKVLNVLCRKCAKKK